MVPARDGVTLATVVALPDRPGPYPTILVRTPYGKGEGPPIQIIGIENVFLPRGYAVVQQDVRGRFRSGGEFVPFLNDRSDTEDTIAWIEKQPWFDGRLGVWGASYLGMTAIMAVLARPDLIKAAFIGVIRSDIYSIAYEHGLPRGDVMGLWALGIRGRTGLALPSSKTLESVLLKFPLADADIRTGERIPYAQTFLKNDLDGPFWRTPLDPDDWAKSPVPTYFFTGWQDFMVEGTIRDYLNRRKNLSRDLYIEVGPWTHLMMEIPPQEYFFPDARGIPFSIPAMLDFFDRYLKGDSTKFIGVPPVRYYDGGRKRWVDDEDLFPSTPSTLTLYLSAATSSCPHGILSPSPGAPSLLSYTFDPTLPVLLNGASVLDADHGGMRREIQWCARSDAFLFLSPPFAEEVRIAGRITLKLKVSVQAGDGALFAQLILITPEGESFNLRESAMLLSHREGDFFATPVTPGVEYPITLTFPSLRWTLTPGFSLGLALSSSGFPFIPPYTHAGPDWLFSSQAFPATYTYRFDRSSFLEIETERDSQPTP